MIKWRGLPNRFCNMLWILESNREQNRVMVFGVNLQNSSETLS